MTSLRYLLDTNICIYIAKHRPAAVAERFARLSVGEAGMSLITHGELRFGAEKSQRRDESVCLLTRLFELVPVLTPDVSVGEAYGRLRAQLERSGTPMGNNDLWIAAHALSLNLTLVTNSRREFDRAPGLRVENWVG